MELSLCNKSAFNYLRTPPQVLGLYPPITEDPQDSNHLKLASSPIVSDILHQPLHRLIAQQKQCGYTKLYRSHFIKYELPSGSLVETDHGFQITSPAMTLLSLASSISREHLLMTAYELCGSFTVFNPCKRTDSLLEKALLQGLINPNDGWQRVMDVDGHGTTLWKRPPLITRAELEAFCRHAQGFHGVKHLNWVAMHMTGETASPFEVEASMLLSLPRSAGGEGLTILNNHRIQLSATAQTIYPHASCYADILIEGKSSNAGVVIECQGRSVHANEAASISDSNRATALTSMGYEVILLTHEQLVNKRAFSAVLDIITRKAGIKRRPKNKKQLIAEENLRQELFINWNTLGV